MILTADLLAPTLNFLAELSQDTMMKDWLGQPDNCAFWAVLLRALCANGNGSSNMFATSSSQMVKLCDVVLSFIEMHVLLWKNQKYFYSYFYIIMPGRIGEVLFHDP